MLRVTFSEVILNLKAKLKVNSSKLKRKKAKNKERDVKYYRNRKTDWIQYKKKRFGKTERKELENQNEKVKQKQKRKLWKNRQKERQKYKAKNVRRVVPRSEFVVTKMTE
jgi:hypothetical protein